MPASELPANTYAQQLRKRQPPPIDWLREHFEYDPETGIIWHRKRDLLGNRKRADHLDSANGYHRVKPRYQNERHSITAHRLAFALKIGRWPTLIDHIDRDRAQNKWSNLREATNGQNMRNRRATHITKHKDQRAKQGFKWRIVITNDGHNRTTDRRDFCAAWKVRQAWLAERDAH